MIVVVLESKGEGGHGILPLCASSHEGGGGEGCKKYLTSSGGGGLPIFFFFKLKPPNPPPPPPPQTHKLWTVRYFVNFGYSSKMIGKRYYNEKSWKQSSTQQRSKQLRNERRMHMTHHENWFAAKAESAQWTQFKPGKKYLGALFL